MKIPTLAGVIDRRVLVNYRVDPEVMAAQLPAPFRPKLYRGFAMAGVCLIRLKQVRPAFLPGWLELSSENAAHRVAVEWVETGQVREGVFVRRRDTNSGFNTLVGGRLFPGEHHRAIFASRETDRRIEIEVDSRDGEVRLAVAGKVAEGLPATSIFESLEAASDFYAAGSLGYSVTRDAGRFQSLELRCQGWKVEPLAIERARSNYFDDCSLFPEGSIEFDCALLMRGVVHGWLAKPDLCCPAATAAVA